VISLQSATLRLSIPNYSGDASLVDPANMDLHIKVGSAAIDAANVADSPDIDLDGDVRPQGGGVDIGADELM